MSEGETQTQFIFARGFSRVHFEEAKRKMHQEVVDVHDVQRYLKEGWTFLSTFNATHARVEIEVKSRSLKRS
jgi:hypothetical protein